MRLDVDKDEVVACAVTMSGRKVTRTSAWFPDQRDDVHRVDVRWRRRDERDPNQTRRVIDPHPALSALMGYMGVTRRVRRPRSWASGSGTRGRCAKRERGERLENDGLHRSAGRPLTRAFAPKLQEG